MTDQIKILENFVHTHEDIHGKGCKKEFLIPNIFEGSSSFVGLTTGTEYELGLFVRTHRKWNENIILNLIKKVKPIGFFGRNKKKLILKRYIQSIVENRDEFMNSIMKIDESMNLYKFSTRRSFLSKKSRSKQLAKSKLEAFNKLGELCLDAYNLNEYKNICKTIKNYDGHLEYQTTMNYFLMKNYEASFSFIRSFDWKALTSELISFVRFALEENYGCIVDIDTSVFKNDSIISNKGVLTSIDKKLNSAGFALGYLETESDEYVLFVHKFEDKELMKEIGKTIQHEYKTVNDYI